MNTFPLYATIDIHNYCNASCSYCPWTQLSHSKEYPKGKMEWSLFTRIIDEFAEHLDTLDEIRFSSIAESWLLPVRDHYEYTVNAGISEQLLITSNMTHLDEDNQQFLDDIGWKGKLFAHVQPDMGVDLEKQKHHHALALERWGPDRVRHVHIQGTGFRRWQYNIETTKIATTCEVDRHRDGTIINFDGRMQLCCQDVQQEEIIGDCSDKTIYEVWNGEQRRAILDRLSKGQVPICNRCDWGKP